MKRLFVYLASAMLFIASPVWADRAMYVPNIVVTDDSLIKSRDQYTYVVDASGNYTTLGAAVDAIKTAGNGGTVWLRHTGTATNTDYDYPGTAGITVATAHEIPANITLKIDNGARIKVATGSTLTINSCPDAGLYNIFTRAGTGAYVLGKSACSEYHPEWFDDSSSDTAGIQELADALTNGGKIVLTRDQYDIEDTITITNSYVSIYGDGAIILTDAGGTKDVLVFDNSPSVLTGNNVNGITIGRAEETPTDGAGIRYTYVSNFEVSNCEFYGRAAVVVPSAVAGSHLYKGLELYNTNNIVVSQNHITYTLNAAIEQTGSSDTGSGGLIIDNYIEYNLGTGIAIGAYSIPFIRRNWIWNNVYGIYIDCVYSNQIGVSMKIMENDIDGNRRYGIFINGGSSYQIANNWFVSNGSDSEGGNASYARALSFDCDVTKNVDDVETVDPAVAVVAMQITDNYFNGSVAKAFGGGSADAICMIGNCDAFVIDGNMFFSHDTAINTISGAGTSAVDGLIINDNLFSESTTGIDLTAASVPILIGSNMFSGTTGTTIDTASISAGLEISGNVLGVDENIIDFTPATLPTWTNVLLDSSGGAMTLTLPNGTHVGQMVTIAMKTAGNNADLSITNHETSDPEVVRFDAVDETGVFMWTGTEWVTIYATCTFPDV